MDFNPRHSIRRLTNLPSRLGALPSFRTKNQADCQVTSRVTRTVTLKARELPFGGHRRKGESSRVVLDVFFRRSPFFGVVLENNKRRRRSWVNMGGFLVGGEKLVNLWGGESLSVGDQGYSLKSHKP